MKTKTIQVTISIQPPPDVETMVRTYGEDRRG